MSDWHNVVYPILLHNKRSVLPDPPLCQTNFSFLNPQVRLRFKEIQRSKEKLTSHVTREEFQDAYCELCTRPDVYFLLVQLSKDRECLDPQDLRLFLETEQGLSLATTKGCWELLRRCEPSVQGREMGLLGLDGFTRYLQSPECQLLDPEHLAVCQDMNMPLSHYYIRCESHFSPISRNMSVKLWLTFM